MQSGIYSYLRKSNDDILNIQELIKPYILPTKQLWGTTSTSNEPGSRKQAIIIMMHMPVQKPAYSMHSSSQKDSLDVSSVPKKV